VAHLGLRAGDGRRKKTLELLAADVFVAGDQRSAGFVGGDQLTCGPQGAGNACAAQGCVRIHLGGGHTRSAWSIALPTLLGAGGCEAGAVLTPVTFSERPTITPEMRRTRQGLAKAHLGGGRLALALRCWLRQRPHLWLAERIFGCR